MIAGQRVLYDGFIFSFHKQKSNGRSIIGMTKKVINGILIHIQLANETRLKITSF